MTNVNRYDKIVLEAENGIIFDVSTGLFGELIIKAHSVATGNAYSENYVNPPIPNGYKYICGKWENGFVIERDSDGSQFVWIPVGFLKPNGTLDSIRFNEKFGRRKYNDICSEDRKVQNCNEELVGELFEQIESVKKYGGFYISRFNISVDKKGNPQSKKGYMPWQEANVNKVLKAASQMENNKDVTSHLIFGAEYDSVLEWFIQSGQKGVDEIEKNSTGWGNYYDAENSPKKVVETGSCEEWCVNNIYDFAGNVEEWTQEKHRGVYVIRGAGYSKSNVFTSVSIRRNEPMDNDFKDNVGFRVALCIK